MDAVREARPTPSALEMEPFHKRKFHRLGGMTGNRTGIMRDDFTDAIVASVGISEMKESSFFIQLFRQ